jgi:hypothetical protein
MSNSREGEAPAEPVWVEMSHGWLARRSSPKRGSSPSHVFHPLLPLPFPTLNDTHRLRWEARSVWHQRGRRTESASHIPEMFPLLNCSRPIAFLSLLIASKCFYGDRWFTMTIQYSSEWVATLSEFTRRGARGCHSNEDLGGYESSKKKGGFLKPPFIPKPIGITDPKIRNQHH